MSWSRRAASRGPLVFTWSQFFLDYAHTWWIKYLNISDKFDEGVVASLDIHIIYHLVATEFWLSRDNFFQIKTRSLEPMLGYTCYSNPSFFIMTLIYLSNVYAFSDFVHLVPIDYCYKQYSKLLGHGAFG